MTTFPQQTKQPVPLFYGVLPSGLTVVALQPDFDYVITAWRLSSYESSAGGAVLIADESDVLILELGVGEFVTQNPDFDTGAGEFPIGPRTTLNITATEASMHLFLGGYALNPVTALHV